MDGLIMENPSKMDDLGVPLFSETPIYYIIISKSTSNIFIYIYLYGKSSP